MKEDSLNLLQDLRELAGDVGGVAVQDGSVTGTDLTGVVQDDNLGVERSSLHRWVVLTFWKSVEDDEIMGSTYESEQTFPRLMSLMETENMSETKNRQTSLRTVLDVEADVVSGETLGDLLVVHLDGLDFGGHVGRGEGDDHTGLDDTGLDSADGHCADTTDLVDILQRESQGLVSGTLRRVDVVDGLEEGLALGGASLGLLGPSLVPGHAEGGQTETLGKECERTYLVDSSNMLSPCHPEMGTKGTDLGL